MGRKAAVGDNVVSGVVNGEDLKGYVDRLEALDAEKGDIVYDMNEIKKEAKGKGFDPKTLDRVLRIRKMDKEIARAEREMLDSYLAALGWGE